MTSILGGFGYKSWFNMSPASRRIVGTGTGAVTGMRFFYVLFFWLFVLGWVWRNIVMWNA